MWKQEKSLHTKAEFRNWHVLVISGQRALSPEVCKQAAPRHVKAGLLRIPDIKDGHGIRMFWTPGSIPSYFVLSGLPFFPRGGTQILRDTMTCPIDAPRG